MIRLLPRSAPFRNPATTGTSIMGKQGRSLSETKISRIVELLASTDMTIGEIATRMGCAPSTILQVNRQHAVRVYAGHRNRWAYAIQQPVSGAEEGGRH